MPPIRTKHSQGVGSPTTKQVHTKRKHQTTSKEGAAPGVSKIKAALRQTQRLLAKEGLRADVRVEAERKLKALERDLAAGERTNKERALATRYHKIKFFDRQKLLRKIKQLKRRLEDEEISSKARKALEAELFDLRVDLNYVMNYPKLEKYISLFPPEVRSTEEVAKTVHSVASSSVTDEKRESLREWVRVQMRAGEMSSEPETLDHREFVSRKGIARQWDGPIEKKATGPRADEGVKAKQDLDAPDDFFEDDTGNEDNLDVGEPAYTPSVKSPAKRRPDKTVNHPDKHSEQTENYPKKAKRKRLEKLHSPAIQDGFFDDEGE